MKWITAAALSLFAATAGCAGGLGGGSPLVYRAIALDLSAPEPADSVGAVVRQAAADLALVAAPADSAWFAAAARAANLHLSGPIAAANTRLAFLAMKPTGDTTVTVKLASGRNLVLHDALYQPQKKRYVDLMLARADSGAAASEIARSLLTYAAGDVMQNAAVIMGLITRPAAVADSVAALIPAVYVDLRRCTGAGTAAAGAGVAAANTGVAAATSGAIRVFYGPETNIRCDDARLLPNAGAPVYAHFTIGAKP